MFTSKTYSILSLKRTITFINRHIYSHIWEVIICREKVKISTSEKMDGGKVDT